MPALHQEFAIVDAEGNECPPGVEGEMTAGGPQTAIGYLLDDGSIDPVLGNRIKTGDLGMMDEEGFVRVTGRTKDLIIRGGMNIAPAEIDEMLLRHPGILKRPRSACRTRSMARKSCATWCRRTSAHRGRRAHALRSFLPPPKMPKQVFFVAELPKSDRGKVLRDRLRED